MIIEVLYKSADIFFVVFHTALILFNVLGWIWKKTRRLNFYTLILTGASWFILGIFYGMGFCPLTQWHFEILEKLGHSNLPRSYIQYLIERLSGFMFNARFVDTITFIVFFIALIMSVILNIRQEKNKSGRNSGFYSRYN